MAFQKLYFSDKKGSKNRTISRYERTIQDNCPKNCLNYFKVALFEVALIKVLLYLLSKSASIFYLQFICTYVLLERETDSLWEILS